MTVLFIDILVLYLLIYVRAAMSPHTKKIMRNANLSPVTPWLAYLLWPRLAFCDVPDSLIFFYKFEILWAEPER